MTPLGLLLTIGSGIASVTASIVAYTAARSATNAANVILNVQRVMDAGRRQRAAQNVQPRVDRPRTAATPAGPAQLNWATQPTDPQPPVDTRTGFRPPARRTPGQAG